MSGINFERLDAAITHAYEHPEEFDMQDWFVRSSCGTTACLAGTAAMLAGWKPVFRHTFYAFEVKRGGQIADVESVATDLLGLNFDQSGIFGASGLRAVINVRNEWAREAGVPERTWGES